MRAVDDDRIEATVAAKEPINVTIEWSTGTGPQALRSVCACGGNGVCEHIVATLEAVRLHGSTPPGEADASEDDYGWLPQLQVDAPRARARSIWPVISSDGKTLVGTLYLDTPRLRGVMRDAESISAMMESTPVDDWDAADRELVRDEAILEAFAARSLGGNQYAGRGLARALFRLQRHPRVRFDDAPAQNRHPSSLPVFAVDVRGVRLRAVRSDGHFVPMLEDADGTRFSPANGWLLDGPPSWFGTPRGAYLLDGTFDTKRVIEAAQRNGAASNGKPPSTRTIARVAPFLPPEERSILGVVDAERPKIRAVLNWREGALVARCTLIDEATAAQVVYSALGGVAEVEGRFIRFDQQVASALVRPLVEAGFVPRGSDAFALHGPERAAKFVRETLPEWNLDYELDPALDALTGDRSSLDFRVSAIRSGERPDWFELAVDVFVGEGDPLTQKELQALLSTTGRFAEIRGKLVDVAKLRAREALLADLSDRKRTGFAALLALRDELHESFEGVALPAEVERLRERLREFSGIETIEPPGDLGDVLRDYQRRGLDFLAYLAGFGFGGILADDMGVGKSVTLDTKILTPAGWKAMRDIRLGDAVVNAQGTASNVVGVYPQGLREAFEVTFSDGAKTICCDEHLWAVSSAVRKKRGNPHVVLALKDIRERLHDAAGNARWYIPMVAPVQFEQRVLPIDPYALGLVLGDGSVTQNTPMFSSADEGLVDALAGLLPTGTEVVAASGYDFRLRGPGRPHANPLTRELRELGLMGCYAAQKFIPEPYKFSSVDDRLRLLQGLMDADGYGARGYYAEFNTVSERLARDVRELVQSLGGTARLRQKMVNGYVHNGERRFGQTSYRVSVALPNQFNPFALNRKADGYHGRSKDEPTRAIVSVRPVGPREMQCIAVDSPDRLFVIEDYVVTHNTLQTIAYLKWRKEKDGPSPSLVIAPTSVTHSWESEITRFAPDLSTLRLQSGADRAATIAALDDYDVVITSYALARLDAEALTKRRFRTLVLDEAQNAKNPSSQISKVVRALQADHRIALTGTPVENSLRDLWAIFSFLEPGLLGTEGSFRRRFEVPIADGDEKAVNALRSRLEPFVLRRTKEDVARELPERTEVLLECDLSPTQLRMYRGIAEAARRDVLSQIGANGMEGAAVHVLAALTRLRQVCAHPGLLVDSYIGEPEVSGKFDAFLETIEEILSGNHRVLVFSAFASMLRLMRAHFEKAGVAYGYLDGSTKDRDRRDQVEQFMRPDGPPMFLCSLKAGGVGLTLTAADYVILYDPWWNPAIERQAIDRTHRIGQHRAVTAYRLVTRGSVEEKIRALAERKASLSKTVVKTDSAVAKSLTREDLELLFADPEG